MAHYVASANEFPVDVKVKNGITKVQFANDNYNRILGVSTWDGFVKILDVSNPNAPIDKRNQYHTKPVLAFTFMGGADFIVSGDTDGNVKLYNVEAGRDNSMGKHEKGVRCLEYSPTMRWAVSGSWDKLMKLWDVRTTGRDNSMGKHEKGVRCLEYSPTMRWAVSGSWDKLMKLWDVRTSMPVHATEVEDKVYALSTVDYRAVIGTSDRRVLIYDLRNLRGPLQNRESPLKYQTRSIKCFPDGHAFVMSSIEGRVAVEYFDLNPDIQKNKYAFKCHRQKVDDSEFIYPVNAIAFHPQFNSFATGGSDGLVNVWDPQNRKRLCQLRKFNTSVVSLDFSSDGQYVALATTYMYESDVPPVPIPDPEVMVRKITDFEVKPK
uniref:Translation initiation factor beta propellor-like domain-containing protein n=1 Tax=Panagrolaimus davidi TaxID=227884 RepID=A0A914QHJ0_9BILA